MRCGYTDDGDDDVLALGRWRAQVESAIRGKRGQRFFRDLIAALDALPEKELAANELETTEGAVCALGALGKHQGKDVSALDTEDYDQLGSTFDIASQLAQETMYVNDEECRRSSPEERFSRVRRWAVRKLRLTPEEIGAAEVETMSLAADDIVNELKP